MFCRPPHPLAAAATLLLLLDAAASTPVTPGSLAADISEETIDADAVGLALLRDCAATESRITELPHLDSPQIGSMVSAPGIPRVTNKGARGVGDDGCFPHFAVSCAGTGELLVRKPSVHSNLRRNTHRATDACSPPDPQDLVDRSGTSRGEGCRPALESRCPDADLDGTGRGWHITPRAARRLRARGAVAR